MVSRRDPGNQTKQGVLELGKRHDIHNVLENCDRNGHVQFPQHLKQRIILVYPARLSQSTRTRTICKRTVFQMTFLCNSDFSGCAKIGPLDS